MREQSSARRLVGLPGTVLIVFSAGCAALAPTPIPPPQPSFELLVDIGIFGGPPALPPPYALVDFGEDSLLLVVDRGRSHGFREVRWNGARWESVAGMDAQLMPADEEGPYLRTLSVGTDQGFSSDATVLLGRVPNGPINRFEIAIDGAVEEVWVHQRPVFVAIFDVGTEIGAEFTAFDAGSFELERGVVHSE